jgi:transcriptional regulator with XRE-family HTH domain
MRLEEKIKVLLKKRGLTSVQLRAATGLSRATMSRILRGHVPAGATLARIAEVLEVSPEYLRGGYQLPAWLTEEDIMFLASQGNAPLLRKSGRRRGGELRRRTCAS